MYRRPWPIVLIGILHILEPLFKLAFNWAYFHTAPSQLLRGAAPWELVLFFGALPIAGIALLAFRKWSYFVFILMEVVTLSSLTMTWMHSPSVLPIPFFLVINFLNLAVVSYFLIPAVRVTYYDSRLRWWEHKPRYQVSIPCRVGDQKGMIRNLSEGGVFWYSDSPVAELVPAQEYRLEFQYENQIFALHGKAIHKTRATVETEGGTHGFGVQFVGLSPEKRRDVRKLTQLLRKRGHETTIQLAPWTEDLAQWLKRVPGRS